MKKIYIKIQNEDEIVIPKCIIPNSDNMKSTFIDRNRIPVTKRIYDGFSYAQLKQIRVKSKKTV